MSTTAMPAANPASGVDAPLPRLTPWHVLLSIAVLVTLSGFSAWVVHYYERDTATNAATILGIVVPAFATIGAAAFGVTIAYKAGQARGEASGQQQGQVAQTAAVSSVRKQTTDLLSTHIDEAERALDDLHTDLLSRAFSPPGQSRHLFGLREIDVSTISREGIELTPEPVEVNLTPLDTARASILRAKGAIEALSM